MNKIYMLLGVGAASAIGAGAYFFTRKTAPVSAASNDTPSITAPDFEFTNPLALTSGQDFMNSISNGVATVLGGEPRGIRNKNPLNIKWNSLNNWNGQLGKDSGGFCIFDTPENGIRAAARNLKSYAKAGYTTVDKIIRHWTEGDSTTIQNAYIANVCAALGVSSNSVVNIAQYPVMLAAMIKQENGKQPYSMALITAAVNAS